jgi:rare lipoprotein A
VALLSSGCSLFHRPSPAPSGPEQVGVASWYGSELRGNRTASGDRFDEKEFSAAHPTLPLGTRARVTNLENGRSLIVRINDRGPFVRGRSIDVSYAAARALGMVGRGTARVRIQALDDASRKSVTGRARVRRGESSRRRRRGSRRRGSSGQHDTADGHRSAGSVRSP